VQEPRYPCPVAPVSTTEQHCKEPANDILGGQDPFSGSKACAKIIYQTYYHSYFKNKVNFEVKNSEERLYILAIAALVDKQSSCIVGSAAEAEALISLIEKPEFRRNAIQDIRNGRLFDRQAKIPNDPSLRNEIEKFIFRGRGDPERSLEISDDSEQ
jgi:hypothetical protein